jgi:putative molybdopterin biosynthesis protein
MEHESAPVELVRAQEVADSLALPLRAVYVLVEQGELPAYRLGRRLRFDRSDIRRFLEDRRESFEDRS